VPSQSLHLYQYSSSTNVITHPCGRPPGQVSPASVWHRLAAHQRGYVPHRLRSRGRVVQDFPDLLGATAAAGDAYSPVQGLRPRRRLDDRKLPMTAMAITQWVRHYPLHELRAGLPAEPGGP
jgi:hypothetical protein